MSKNKPNIFVPNKESFVRMNFLYQASMLMANNTSLSAYYAQQCQSIGKKAQLKISPEIKRNFCKRCALAQQPGLTSDLEIFPSKRKQRRKNKRANGAHENIDMGAEVFMKCRKCGNKRKFIVNPSYNFWLEKPEAVEETKTQMPTANDAKNQNESKNNLKSKTKENAVKTEER